MHVPCSAMSWLTGMKGYILFIIVSLISKSIQVTTKEQAASVWTDTTAPFVNQEGHGESETLGWSLGLCQKQCFGETPNKATLSVDSALK